MQPAQVIPGSIPTGADRVRDAMASWRWSSCISAGMWCADRPNGIAAVLAWARRDGSSWPGRTGRRSPDILISSTSKPVTPAGELQESGGTTESVDGQLDVVRIDVSDPSLSTDEVGIDLTTVSSPTVSTTRSDIWWRCPLTAAEKISPVATYLDWIGIAQHELAELDADLLKALVRMDFSGIAVSLRRVLSNTRAPATRRPASRRRCRRHGGESDGVALTGDPPADVRHLVGTSS